MLDHLVNCLAALVYLVLEVSCTCAGLFAYNYAAACLDEVVHLPVRNSHRCSCDEDPLLSFSNVYALCNSLVELVAQLVDHCCESLRIIIVSDLADQQCICSGDRNVEVLSLIIQSLQCSSLSVDGLDTLSELFSCYFVSCFLLNEVLEILDLISPLEIVLRSLHLWKIHDMHRNVCAEDLISLLLSVTGVLSDIYVSESVERACSVESCSEHSLDQRACVGRKISLTARYPELRSCAEACSDSISSYDNFIRYISTECAEYLAAVLSELYELSRSETVNISEDHVKIVHALRSVLLGHKYVSDCSRKYCAQLVVHLEVHSEFAPHFLIVCHNSFLPLIIIST